MWVATACGGLTTAAVARALGVPPTGEDVWHTVLAIATLAPAIRPTACSTSAA